MEDNMGSLCSQIGSNEAVLSQVKPFTAQLLALPELHRGETITAKALAEKVHDDKLPIKFAGRISKEMNPNAELTEEELCETSFLLADFLKHAFFHQKELQDDTEKKQDKLDTVRTKYQRGKATVDRRKARAEQSLKNRSKAEESREERLSKRNFLNRTRNKIKKYKVERAADDRWTQEDLQLLCHMFFCLD